MNRKILIVLIAIVALIGIGAFAMTNMGTGQSASVNVDANALENMGNLVVNATEDSKEKDYFLQTQVT